MSWEPRPKTKGFFVPRFRLALTEARPTQLRDKLYMPFCARSKIRSTQKEQEQNRGMFRRHFGHTILEKLGEMAK